MRPGHDEWGLCLTEVVAQRATCLRRSVGCVLMNARHQVLSTGYNGRAAGLPHCNHIEMKGYGYAGVAVDIPKGVVPSYPNACPGARAASGTQLDSCEAIHAEQNALLQCRDVYQIDACYVTHSPCITCVKLLMNTSCRRIVFRTPYAHDEPARKLWLESQYVDTNGVRWTREWIHVPRE